MLYSLTRSPQIPDDSPIFTIPALQVIVQLMKQVMGECGVRPLRQGFPDYSLELPSSRGVGAAASLDIQRSGVVPSADAVPTRMSTSEDDSSNTQSSANGTDMSDGNTVRRPSWGADMDSSYTSDDDTDGGDRD
uniref:Light-independent protochlorophyllide reductase subunit B n=1 Tax=Lygus hesperus TaxID=30085 RepID=A0A0A9YRD6_LYGHE